ncbi:MAG: molybdenum cofactor guanylyltransferase [Anaeromyxobacter sp.]
MRPLPALTDISGALLAGGRGSRLGGVPKGLLQREGRPIAAGAIQLMEALFDSVFMVADDPAPYRHLGVPIIPDQLPGRGAPGGLHAALHAARTPWVFTAACDMPFLAEASIRALAAARHEGAQVVVVRWAGRLQPLHALWARAALPAVEAALREGTPSLRALVAALPARVLEEEEWRAVDPEGRCLEDADTPEDAARLGLDHQL